MSDFLINIAFIKIIQQLLVIQLGREKTGICTQFSTPLVIPVPIEQDCEILENILLPMENKRRNFWFLIIQSEEFPKLSIPPQAGYHILLDTVDFVHVNE